MWKEGLTSWKCFSHFGSSTLCARIANGEGVQRICIPAVRTELGNGEAGFAQPCARAGAHVRVYSHVAPLLIPNLQRLLAWENPQATDAIAQYNATSYKGFLCYK